MVNTRVSTSLHCCPLISFYQNQTFICVINRTFISVIINSMLNTRSATSLHNCPLIFFLIKIKLLFVLLIILFIVVLFLPE